MSESKSLRAIGDRVAALVDELTASGDERVRAKAEELVRSLMQLYGGGLERMLEIVHDEGSRAEAAATADRLFARFADDGVVATLMLLHGLHPLDTATRVQRALAKVRPALAAHGGDVTLLAVERSTVRLRLEGSCHGCPSSTVTMKVAVEQAIEEAAPEVVSIEVEGAVALPERTAPGECLAGSAASGSIAPRATVDGGLVQLGGRDAARARAGAGAGLGG